MAAEENPQNLPDAPSPAAEAAQSEAQVSAPATAAPRDSAYWAAQGRNLHVTGAPRNQVNNVDGRSAMSPLQGFGQMWQKTYRIRLVGAEVRPVEVIRVWKENFPTFWPKGNRFYLPLTGINPGEVAMLSIRAGGVPLSTGVLVLYADDESFTLMTPQGHVFAGWITFSSFTDDECTIAQAQVLMRTNDPIYELGARMGGHRQENIFWQKTLTAVAARFGVTGQLVDTQVVCVDPRVRWAYARNIVHNAAVRTMLLGPTRWFRRG